MLVVSSSSEVEFALAKAIEGFALRHARREGHIGSGLVSVPSLSDALEVLGGRQFNILVLDADVIRAERPPIEAFGVDSRAIILHAVRQLYGAIIIILVVPSGNPVDVVEAWSVVNPTAWATVDVLASNAFWSETLTKHAGRSLTFRIHQDIRNATLPETGGPETAGINLAYMILDRSPRCTTVDEVVRDFIDQFGHQHTCNTLKKSLKSYRQHSIGTLLHVGRLLWYVALREQGYDKDAIASSLAFGGPQARDRSGLSHTALMRRWRRDTWGLSDAMADGISYDAAIRWVARELTTPTPIRMLRELTTTLFEENALAISAEQRRYVTGTPRAPLSALTLRQRRRRLL